MKEKAAVTRLDFTVESIILDADLFVKYKSPERAVGVLRDALDRSPRSILLREKLREVCATQGQIAEAARQCLALANLYINREDFESAYDRLQEAKLLDPRISIAPGLEAIRRAKHPEFSASHSVAQAHRPTAPIEIRRDAVLAGNLQLITFFDAVQVLENARLTGLLTLKNEERVATVSFNLGQIVNAETESLNGTDAFRKVVEFTNGTFEFTLSVNEFPVVIQAASNTNLLLDTLSAMDEESQNVGGSNDDADWGL
jgi:tetratricopeptide (TPR) repeat protein